jgi:DNA replication protein DnaC
VKSLAEVLLRVAHDHPTTRTTGRTTPPSEIDPSVCPICHGAGYVVYDVPVGHPDFGRPQPCRCTLQAQAAGRAAQLRTLSNVGHLQRLTFDRFLPEGIGLSEERRRSLRAAYEHACRYAEQPENWLVLHGGVGTGKTHLAAAIANERLAHNEPVLFVVVPDLLDTLRSAFSPQSETTFDERFEQVRSAPLLILDDLGAHSTTPWAQEKLYQIINFRYNTRLPTVVTTNYRLDEIDDRVRSRLTDPEISMVIEINAPDFRAGKDATDPGLSSLALHEDQTFASFDLRAHELPAEPRESLRRALAAAQRFADSPAGWLVFTGPYHCGKTHLAAAIALERRAAQLDHPLFVFVPDLLDFLRAAFNPTSHLTLDKRFEQVKKATLLILDDLGAESSSSWANEKLFQLLNYRYVAKLPTVITVAKDNLPLEERLHTRVFDPRRSEEVAMNAPAYRAGKARPAAYDTPAKGRARRS